MGSTLSRRRAAGLEEKPRSSRSAFLTASQREQLAQFIKTRSQSETGGRLIGSDIHAYIAQEFDKHYHPDSIYYLLKHMGFSWLTSRSKHPKQSQQVQDDYKKFQTETIIKIPGHVGLNRVDVWFQDEARFGQQNSTTHIWAERGTRPRVVKQVSILLKESDKPAFKGLD